MPYSYLDCKCLYISFCRIKYYSQLVEETVSLWQMMVPPFWSPCILIILQLKSLLVSFNLLFLLMLLFLILEYACTLYITLSWFWLKCRKTISLVLSSGEGSLRFYFLQNVSFLKSIRRYIQSSRWWSWRRDYFSCSFSWGAIEGGREVDCHKDSPNDCYIRFFLAELFLFCFIYNM